MTGLIDQGPYFGALIFLVIGMAFQDPADLFDPPGFLEGYTSDLQGIFALWQLRFGMNDQPFDKSSFFSGK